MNNIVGTLFVIAAPSGGGKTSLVNALLASVRNLKVSVSHTTRPRRPGEEDSVNYHFITGDEFAKMVEQDVFLEQALVHGHYYGTSRRWVEEQLANGIDVILEIDWQGAQQVRQHFPDNSVTIFILPPSRAVLAERLRSRRQDDDGVIERRLAVASSEMAHYHEFDYLVVNDVFEHALSDLQSIIRTARLRQPRQALQYTDTLAELIGNE